MVLALAKHLEKARAADEEVSHRVSGILPIEGEPAIIESGKAGSESDRMVFASEFPRTAPLDPGERVHIVVVVVQAQRHARNTRRHAQTSGNRHAGGIRLDLRIRKFDTGLSWRLEGCVSVRTRLELSVPGHGEYIDHYRVECVSITDVEILQVYAIEPEPKRNVAVRACQCPIAPPIST